MNIDLNEENYDYDSLLNLFSLPENFGISELKQAKKKVLMLHPDKSGLNMEIFIFFYKMYQKVIKVYEYIHHETNVNKMNKNIDINSHFKDYLDRKNIDPINNFKEFSKEFNKMFEHVYVKENNDGYDDWMKSNNDFYDKNNIESSRKKAIQKSSLICQTNIEEVGSLDKNSIKLQGYDVKESLGNPILNIDIEKTYNEKPKFKSVQEYQIYLKKQDDKFEHLSSQQSQLLLNQKNQMLNNQAKNLAYQHLCHQEKTQNKYNDYVSRYLQLEK